MRKRSVFAMFCGILLLSQTMLFGCQRNTGAITDATESVEESGQTEPEGPNPAQSEPEQPEPEQSKPEPTEIQAPYMSREEFPRVNGSTATIPLSQALYRVVTGASQREAEASVSHSKTTASYVELLDGFTDLVIAYEPGPSVYEKMEEKNQKIRMEPIGKDALVFLANEGNPVNSMTEAQLIDVYTGKIASWSLLGGTDQEIVAFQRPENSGSQTLLEKLVMKGTPMAEAPVSQKIGEMGELIEAVAAYDQSDNALGYSVYFYARNMYEKPELRFMAVNGVMPSNKTIQDGTYPFVNEFYAAIREDEPESSPAYQLFLWLTEAGGQRLIEQTGYVPIMQLGDGAAEGGSALGQGTAGTEAEETGAAEIPMRDEERMLISGELLYGTPGVYVMDRNGRIEKSYPDYTMSGSYELADLEEPVVFGLPGYGKRGIYNLAEDTWEIDPEYDSLWKQDDGSFEGYLWNVTNELGNPVRHVLTRDPSTKTWVSRDADLEKIVGDRVWRQTGKDSFEIRTLDGQLLKTLAMSQYGTFSYFMAVGDYVQASMTGGIDLIFDKEGELLLDPREWEGRSYVQVISGEGRWCRGYRQAREGNFGPFVYSLEMREFLTEPGDLVDETRDWFITGETAVRITRNGEAMVLDVRGDKMVSRDGTAYTDIVGDGYYGIREDGFMFVEKNAGQERYRIPCGSDQPVYHVTGSIFGVGNTNYTDSFYSGEELFLSCGYAWPVSSSQWYVFSGTSDDGLIRIVTDEKGEVCYRSEIGEEITNVYEKFLAVYRGNYWELVDYDGKALYRVLAGYLQDD